MMKNLMTSRFHEKISSWKISIIESHEMEFFLREDGLWNFHHLKTLTSMIDRVRSVEWLKKSMMKNSYWWQIQSQESIMMMDLMNEVLSCLGYVIFSFRLIFNILENLEDFYCLDFVLLRRNSRFNIDSHSDSQIY